MNLAQETIAKKRDGKELSADEIDDFVSGYVRGDVADYQAAAFLMATYLRGMTENETAALTRAMAQSGETLDLVAGGIPADAPTIDKHSTGGVGDKTSLIVVPLLAAAGAFVCKMSGRGLGHTGGTLDKLESIPGFRIGLTSDEMIRQVKRIGGCLAGQTDTLAPADKKLYALRDATATVGCLPLIVSSILSKKLAGGAASFLFDVKVGNGALVGTVDEARELAQALVAGAEANGRRATAVLSNMDAPLGNTVGNALEISEAIQMLNPSVPVERKSAPLMEVCLTLAGEALALCGVSASPETGKQTAGALLRSGAGLEKAREIIAAQGGDVKVVDNTSLLPMAPVQIPVLAAQDGFIHALSARRIGEIVVRLGGGRLRKEDTIDPSVGITLEKNVGNAVSRGDVIAMIDARDTPSGEEAAQMFLHSVNISDTPAEGAAMIHNVLRKN